MNARRPADPGATAPDRLPQALLEELSQAGASRTFPAQAVLINEGDTADAIYIVLSGRVKVYAASEEGREIVLKELGPGEVLGELALDGGSRSASVMTMEPTRCCVVPGARLREFFSEHPDFAWHLTRHLMQMVRRLTEQVKSLALQDVYGRTARLLTELSEPEGEIRVLRQKLTQQDIADRVGSSREMVSRIFKQLTIGGYVATEGKRIVLLKKLPARW